MKLRHWLFPASGAAYGWLIWYLMENGTDANAPFTATAMTFVVALAFCSWFAIGIRNLRHDVMFCGGVVLLAVAQVFAFGHLVGLSHIDDTAAFGLFVAQGLWVGIAIAAWRLWGPVQATVLPNSQSPAALVAEIWSVKLSLVFGALAAAILWPALWALIALFNLVGLDGFGALVTEDWVAIPLSWAAFATGILIAHTKSNLLVPVRQIVGGLFRILYPFQALGLFVFLIAVVLGGWKVLVAQEFGVWWTVMSAAFCACYLLFGSLQASDNLTVFGRLGDRILRFSLWVPPIFGAIAIYTIWLRISEYGLTPSRVYGLWSALFMVLATLWLAREGFGRHQSMPAALRDVYGRVLLCLGGMAFVMHLPLMDPLTMSSRSQQARLEQRLPTENSGALPALIQEDLEFMAWRLGRPGEDALADLAQGRVDVISSLDYLRTYRAPNEPPAATRQEIPVFPENHGVSDLVLNQLFDQNTPFDREFCIEQNTGSATRKNVCAVLLVDLDDDGLEEAVTITYPNRFSLYDFDQDAQEWAFERALRQDGDTVTDDPQQFLRDLEAGNFGPVKPRFSDLRIGSNDWRQN
ncbi:DUF4153 domain-containing protein [Thalassospira sp. MA62]|nr:DUF4153 domain-containing protein [Thalassospira sp. MA62]